MLLLPAVAHARTWYVNNVVGSDELTGTTVDFDEDNGPFKTIAMALHVAGPGDRIELAATDAPYRELVRLSGPRHQGLSDRPFVINGNGATLDGTVVAEFGGWQPVGQSVFALRPRRLTFQQLFAVGKPLKRVDLDSPSQLESLLPPAQWAMFDGRMWLKVEPGKLPEDYELRHCGLQTGISLYGVRNVRIENLVIQGFHTDGINAADRVRDCVIAGVECRANGRSGLSVAGASRVDVLDSYFYDNGRVQVRSEGFAKVALDRCEVLDESAPKFSLEGGQLTVDGQTPQQR
jgi:hypothetical protein